ncbi:MAG: hemerythrin domain-containing protein [Rhodospirillales bacterium]|nr:hemerythrin domain-containing protein [Rhodospirillales bacterium]
MFGITSKTGQLLHQDHLNTIATLQKMEEFLVKQTSKRPPDLADEALRRLIKDLATGIDDEITRHFGFEEGHLFPALAEAGESGMTDFLMSEHATIRPIAQDIGRRSREALEKGFTPESWAEYHTIGMEMIEREVFHIQKEEMGLLAAVNALIDADTDAKLSMIFAGA